MATAGENTVMITMTIAVRTLTCEDRLSECKSEVLPFSVSLSGDTL
jgi:hypothetical protein